MLFSQLSYHRRYSAASTLRQTMGVGTAVPEAAQPAVADQGALHFPTWSSSKMPTLDLLRLPLKRDWVARGMASAWAGYAGVCVSSTVPAHGAGGFGLGLPGRDADCPQRGGQFTASTFKTTVTKTLPQLSWLPFRYQMLNNTSNRHNPKCGSKQLSSLDNHFQCAYCKTFSMFIVGGFFCPRWLMVIFYKNCSTWMVIIKIFLKKSFQLKPAAKEPRGRL